MVPWIHADGSSFSRDPQGSVPSIQNSVLRIPYSPRAGLPERPWRNGAVANLLLLLVGVILLPPGRTAEETKEPVFVVETAAGDRVAGPLGKLDADWSLTIGTKRIAGGEVLTLRRKGMPLPALPADEQLILVNGDRIPIAETPRLVGERLHFRHPDLGDGKEVSLPLGALALYWRAPPDKEARPERLRRRLATGTRKRDLVLLRNGDAIEGVLNVLDDRKAEVELNKKTTAVRINQVAGVALNTDLADSLRPKGVFARLVLTGAGGAAGTRLSLTSATCTDGRTLTGTTVFGAPVRVPLARVVVLMLFQGRADYLSDLKADKYEFHPYLDASWPLAVDANVCGGDLRLAGSTYDKGVGLHSRSRVTYTLGGAYRRFEAVVGLDDRCGVRGSVRVRVLADGKALNLGGPRELTARGGPLAVSVSVAGARELTLEVDFGAGGDVEDVVNWANARLIK